jgi:flagellar M-ring protein FliF
VKISVELDFDKEVSSQETFTTPTVNGEQLQQGLVRSNQSKAENSKSSSGTGDVAEGVAGTETNIPEYVAPENQNSNSEYNKDENITNFELDKKNSTYEKSLGQIKRMTVSIALNKDSSYFKDKEVSAEDKAQFQKIVETAVGFNSRRGDTINVEVIPFNRDLENDLELVAQREAQRLKIIYGSTAGIIVLLVLIIIGYGVFRAMEARKLRLQEAKAIEELLPQLEEFELEDKVSVEDQERMDQENQIKLIAKQRPDEVAALIKNWLSEE